MEILSCDKCGKEWEREIRRGKKPKYCVSCEQAARQPLPPRLCLVCGVEYIPTQTRQKYCIGRGCKQKATYRRGIKAQYYCNYCHEPFNPKVSDRTDYCGRECSYNWLHKQKDERAALKRIQDNWKPNKPSPEVECHICGKVVPRVHPWQLRCGSRECSLEHGRRLSKAACRAKVRTCQMCGIEYQAILGGGNMYCSECVEINKKESRQHAKHVRRARIKGNEYESFTRREIMIRDKWECQMCGIGTDPMLDVNDDRYPHLDHIMPLSKGGGHTRANTQCLCRKCNIDKLDKLIIPNKGDMPIQSLARSA